jgi:uncharacterized protein YeaO (DUF488 family)
MAPKNWATKQRNEQNYVFIFVAKIRRKNCKSAGWGLLPDKRSGKGIRRTHADVAIWMQRPTPARPSLAR